MTPGERVVAVARDWIGTPYCHQASCRGAGADCLGLLRGVWRQVFGAEPVVVPPYTEDWSEADGREDLLMAARTLMLPVAPGDEAPGDVLLFRMRDKAVAKHLGIATVVGGAPRFIHAFSGHAVMETALSEPWRRRIVARFRFSEGA